MGDLSRVDTWFNMLFVPGRRVLNLNIRFFFSHIRSLEQAVSTLVNSTAQWSQGSRLGCVHVYSVNSVMSDSATPSTSLPGFSVHGLLQARVLEWVAFSSSRIFPTQGSNPHLLHWQVDSLPLSHPRSPWITPQLYPLRHKNLVLVSQTWNGERMRSDLLILLSKKVSPKWTQS